MYVIILETATERDLRKLDSTSNNRIRAALHKLEADPRPRGAKKLVGFKESWRVRVGGYRVLYEIDDQKCQVHVYRIALRDKAYP